MYQRHLAVMLLSMMMAYDHEVQRNDDNTVTIKFDGVDGDEQNSEITVPNSIYMACGLICNQEAWNPTDEVNDYPADHPAFLNDEEGVTHLEAKAEKEFEQLTGETSPWPKDGEAETHHMVDENDKELEGKKSVGEQYNP